MEVYALFCFLTCVHFDFVLLFLVCMFIVQLFFHFSDLFLLFLLYLILYHVFTFLVLKLTDIEC